MEPLEIGAVIAFLVTFFVAFWIFYDSDRQGHPATLYKTMATAMAVLSLPGLILAASPTLLQGDPTTRQVLTYLGIVAGVAAVVGLILYALRAGLPLASRQPCPSCRRPLDPTWDRCPYCGYSFVTATASRPDEPTPAPAPPSPTPEPPVQLIPETQDTKILRPTPGHFAWLVITNGLRKGQEFRLTDDVFIGRDGVRCQVALEDPAISELHARIKHENGRFTLHDLGSTNGTFVNGEQVYRQTLSDKDRLQLGETELVFIAVREKEVKNDLRANPTSSSRQGTGQPPEGA